jgi:hypothetical protein
VPYWFVHSPCSSGDNRWTKGQVTSSILTCDTSPLSQIATSGDDDECAFDRLWRT